MADHEEHAQHHDHEAYHIEEFGSIEFIEEDVQFKDDSTASHLRRLRKRVMRKRHLQQHFAHKTLYRTAGTRTVSQDELFLDLIIVANRKISLFFRILISPKV